MNKDLIIAKQKEIVEHLKRRINQEYSDIYLWHDMNTTLEFELAQLEQDTSLAKAFIDMEKAKDELFEAIDIICKDYKKT